MKIIVLASHSGSLIRFRGPLLQEMAARGHEVVAAAPGPGDTVTDALAEMGVRYLSVPMARAGLDPLEDLRTMSALFRLLREERPDVLLAYTAKPVIYGLLAARFARVPLRAAIISGRGSALAGGAGLKRRLLAGLTKSLYAVSLRGAAVVFFQNADDERLFRRGGLVGRHQRCVTVDGSGVDLEHYAVAPLPQPPTTFLMIGRLLREKGVFEYVAAARKVKATQPRARFQLLGDIDANPTSLSGDALEEVRTEGVVEYLGTASDVRPVITGAHVIVLPSYHEGMPRSVLEGLSMGRAVITTDAPGCRETVEPGVNGLLVPVADPEALAQAMSQLIDQPEVVAAMGQAGRRLAERRFDVHAVNHDILAVLDL